MESNERILAYLKRIYTSETAESIFQQILQRLQAYEDFDDSSARYAFSEKDVVLITYADQFKVEQEKTLKGLQWFTDTYLRAKFNTVHILPFFPYSSDDGFSVIDYYQVASDFGVWGDIQALSKHFRLMVDGVFNHISRRSHWFQSYLAGDPHYHNYFIEVQLQTDLSAVVRPRTSPLLSSVETAAGERFVWTTFSDDQIDLNFGNPQVFLEIIDVLFFYIQQGARVIRIDAVPFLWKEIGTDCIHRPQTHAMIKALRAILDAAAPGVVLITESNVPFKDNISYLGQVDTDSGVGDEAQLVYQFSLGPLVLHALISGNARKLSDWVEALPSPHLYFNFIASHDGIGLLPAQGILDEADIDLLIKRTEAHGGMLSYKNDTQGHHQVYELNITLYDILNDPTLPRPDLDTARYLASQIIMLELAGVPGVYVHSLFGSSNCRECVEQTGRARSINREKFSVEKLKQDLGADTRTARILSRYLNLVEKRVGHPAFSPRAAQHVLRINESVFALLRADSGSGQQILCLTNLTQREIDLELDFSALGIQTQGHAVHDLISDKKHPHDGDCLSLAMSAYQSLWLLL